MLSAIYLVPRVVGGDLMLLIWAVCTVIYLACGLLRRKNRGKRGRRQLLAGLLVSELLVDISVFGVFFPEGEYRNWGVGAVYAVVLWPAALLTAYVLTAVFGAEQT